MQWHISLHPSLCSSYFLLHHLHKMYKTINCLHSNLHSQQHKVHTNSLSFPILLLDRLERRKFQKGTDSHLLLSCKLSSSWHWLHMSCMSHHKPNISAKHHQHIHHQHKSPHTQLSRVPSSSWYCCLLYKNSKMMFQHWSMSHKSHGRLCIDCYSFLHKSLQRNFVHKHCFKRKLLLLMPKSK